MRGARRTHAKVRRSVPPVKTPQVQTRETMSLNKGSKLLHFINARMRVTIQDS